MTEDEKTLVDNTNPNNSEVYAPGLTLFYL